MAHHEMGHALAAVSLPGMDPVHKVSIIPRSIGALGYTMQRPTEDRFLITAGELKDRMVVLMAGRAAEDLIFGEISTGAADDLAKVTDIARQIVTRFGMSKEVGQAVLEQQRSSYLGDTLLNVAAAGLFGGDRARGRPCRTQADRRGLRARQGGADQTAEGSGGRRQAVLEKETITPDDFPPLKPAKAGADRGGVMPQPRSPWM